MRSNLFCHQAAEPHAAGLLVQRHNQSSSSGEHRLQRWGNGEPSMRKMLISSVTSEGTQDDRGFQSWGGGGRLQGRRGSVDKM